MKDVEDKFGLALLLTLFVRSAALVLLLLHFIQLICVSTRVFLSTRKVLVYGILSQQGGNFKGIYLGKKKGRFFLPIREQECQGPDSTGRAYSRQKGIF